MLLVTTVPLGADALANGRHGPHLVVAGRARSVEVRRDEEVPRRERGWVLDLVVEVPVDDPERVLAESEGYAVERQDGSHVGVVEEVETDPATGLVSALLVAVRLGLRQLRVDADGIEALYPTERRIIVLEGAVPPPRRGLS
jgi:hypothetical protein